MNPHIRKLLQLSAHPGSPPVWFLPLWATVCGAVAAATDPPTRTGIARLILALFLVELGWGELWLALTATDWATPLGRWQRWKYELPHPPAGDAITGEGYFFPVLPYARPGSPADRLARWLAQLTSWGQMVFLPLVGPALGSALVGLLLSLALSAVLGRDFLLLTLGILASAQLVTLASGGRGSAGPGAGLAFRVALGWLAGHLTFAPLALPSAALAGALSLAASGAEDSPGMARRALWVGGFLGAMLLLVVLQRPLAVPFIAFLALPPFLTDAAGGSPRWFRRYGVWLAAAMGLAAMAV
ncbi:MAG: hypothetical protein H5T61_14335 [Thermoflexales bacterium]|nr:hypothetical protein [Thermoflexales bacterium]